MSEWVSNGGQSSRELTEALRQWFQGQGSLASYSPWGQRVGRDWAIAHTHTHTHTHKVVEWLLHTDTHTHTHTHTRLWSDSFTLTHTHTHIHTHKVVKWLLHPETLSKEAEMFSASRSVLERTHFWLRSWDEAEAAQVPTDAWGADGSNLSEWGFRPRGKVAGWGAGLSSTDAACGRGASQGLRIMRSNAGSASRHPGRAWAAGFLGKLLG